MSQKILNLIDSIHRQVDRLQTPEAINRVLLQTLNEIKLMCLREKMSEASYAKDQPIWYHTGGKKLPATFLEYIGMTVQIRTHGSMHPQNVDLSYISPREEEIKG